MNNVFDQFDEKPSNVFDQFDEQPKTGGYLSQSKPIDALEERLANKAKPDFLPGIARGVDQVQGMTGGFLEATGESLGIESLTDYGRDVREGNEAEAGANAKKLEFTDISDSGGIVDWLQATIGETLAQAAPSIASASAVATAGAAIGSVVPGLGTAFGGTIGGLLGAFIPSYVLGVGEVQGEIKRRGGTNPSAAFIGGSAIAALDSVLPGKIGSKMVKQFGMDAAEEVAKQTLGKSAKDLGKNMGVEAVTEGAQGQIGQYAAAKGTDTPYDPKLKDVVNEMAAGAIGGGIMSSPSTVASYIQARRKDNAIHDELDKHTGDALSAKDKAEEGAKDDLTAAEVAQGGAQPNAEEMTSADVATESTAFNQHTRDSANNNVESFKLAPNHEKAAELSPDAKAAKLHAIEKDAQTEIDAVNAHAEQAAQSGDKTAKQEAGDFQTEIEQKVKQAELNLGGGDVLQFDTETGEVLSADLKANHKKNGRTNPYDDMDVDQLEKSYSQAEMQLQVAKANGQDFNHINNIKVDIKQRIEAKQNEDSKTDNPNSDPTDINSSDKPTEQNSANTTEADGATRSAVPEQELQPNVRTEKDKETAQAKENSESGPVPDERTEANSSLDKVRSTHNRLLELHSKESDPKKRSALKRKIDVVANKLRDEAKAKKVGPERRDQSIVDQLPDVSTPKVPTSDARRVRLQEDKVKEGDTTVQKETPKERNEAAGVLPDKQKVDDAGQNEAKATLDNAIKDDGESALDEISESTTPSERDSNDEERSIKRRSIADREGSSEVSKGNNSKYARRNNEGSEGKPEIEGDAKEVESALDTKAHEAATSPENDLPEPTEAQKEAGNYKVGKVKLHGLDLSIENPKGSIRSGKDKNGKKWSQKIQHHYGYIKGTEAIDGDQVDIFLGSEAESDSAKVFVIDQVDPKTKEYDEAKVMFGFQAEGAAIKAYLSNYEKGWKGNGGVTAMSLDEFKAWVDGGEHKKPLSKRVRSRGVKPTIKTDDINKLEDFGETLAGARKFLHALQLSLSTDVNPKSVPLSKSFPKPNYTKLADDGVNHETLAIIAFMRGQIPTKPRRPGALQRWSNQVDQLRSTAKELLDNPNFKDRYIASMLSNTDSAMSDAASVVTLADKVPADKIERLVQFKVGETQWSLYQGKKDVKKTMVTDTKANAGWGGTNNMTGFDSLDAALDHVLSEVKKDKKQSVKAKVGVKLDIYRLRSKPGWIIGKKISGQKYLDLKTGFESATEARAYLDDNTEALRDQLIELKKRKPTRRKTNEARAGDDWRNGEDATAKMFDDAFGFRGVQFGNWVEGAKRQSDLNNAYDSLMDLSAIIGVPSKALSLNRTLGLAFGARGKGGANKGGGATAAHFEPDMVVINLTKKMGAGSLAHEWWHAADNYFAAQEEQHYSGDGTYMSETQRNTRIRDGAKLRDAVDSDFTAREELYSAFRGVVNAIEKETKLVDRSKKLDAPHGKAYWSTVREMTARSFERYVIGKLEESGASNDYLANIISEEAHIVLNTMERESGLHESPYAYPLQAEMSAVNAAYGNLFETVKTKETDEGVAMFSSAKKKAGKPIDLKKLESIYAKISKKWKGTPGIKVVESANELPAGVKGEANRQGLKLKAVNGVLHNGELYVVRKSITSERQAEELVFHEMYGHLGVRRVFNGKPLKALSELYQKIGGADGIERLSNKYGIVLDHYKKGVSKLSKVEQESIIMDELLAHIAQKESGSLKQKARELISKIRQWLRDHGFVKLAELNQDQADDAVTDLLAKSRKSLFQDATGKTSGTVFHRAWHGTPYEFEGFSTSQIGSGEGAQAYGHGLYFAGNKDVAEYYQKVLSGDKNEDFAIDMIQAAAPGMTRMPAKWIQKHIAKGEAAEKAIERVMWSSVTNNADFSLFEKHKDKLISETKKASALGFKGSLYQVDLKPKEDEYLQWDKPLEEQSETVNSALTQAGFSGQLNDGIDLTDKTGGALYKLMEMQAGESSSYSKKLIEGAGYDPYGDIEHINNDQMVSEYLKSIGIRGIKYLDGNSRTNGAGGYNYVIFDDGDIEIESRFSVKPDGDYSDAEHAEEILNTKIDEGSNWDDNKVSIIKRIGVLSKGARRSALALLSRRQLVEVSEKLLPRARVFLRHNEQMDADRIEWQSKAADVTETWGELSSRARKGLAKVMHASTVAGVDPSKPFKVGLSESQFKEQLKILEAQALVKARTKSGNTDTIIQIMQLKERYAKEQGREASYPSMVKAWNVLSQEQKDVYNEARDYHEAMSDEMLDALLERLEESGSSIELRNDVSAQLRLQFETAKAHSPYFPLSRFGEYVVAVGEGPKKTVDFFETEKDAVEFREEMKAKGHKVSYTKKFDDLSDMGMVPLQFINDVNELIKGADSYNQEQQKLLKDGVYQLYLQSLPEMSSRKHSIHRAKVRGFSDDALRSFAHVAFHGSSNLAKVKHAHKIQGELDALKKDVSEADTPDVTLTKIDNLKLFKDHYLGDTERDLRKKAKITENEELNAELHEMSRLAGVYRNEIDIEREIERLQVRLDTAANISADIANVSKASDYVSEFSSSHDAAMSSKVSPIATWANQLGFTFYLGLTPAAALVNTFQVPMVTIPLLGGTYGNKKATAAVGRAYADYFKHRQKNHMPTIETSLKGDDLAAYKELVRRGVIDKTQAHDLAGMAEEGARYSATTHKVMGVLSFGFHHAEKLNREVTAMAAYRLARADGDSMTVAIEKAGDLTFKSQFDYGSTNRARLFRGNTARVVTQFKQYSQGITYLYGRTLVQAFKGETEAAKKEASKQLYGMLLAQFAVTGLLGMPLVRVAGMLAESLIHGLGDEDDEFDYEAWIRQQSADILGNGGGTAFSKGIFDAITPASLHGRLSISELWYREPLKELEGKDSYFHLMEQLLGPVVGGMAKGAFTGMSHISEGNVYRGIEQAIPKVLRDQMKAVRYGTEGVTTYDGNVIQETRIMDSVIQSLGFSPSNVSNRYDENSAKKGREAAIAGSRKELIAKTVSAQLSGNTKQLQKLYIKIREFNQRHPYYPIASTNIRRSMAAKLRARNDMEHGQRINKKLRGITRGYDFAE